MILVDDRVGSRELLQYLPASDVLLTHLEFGDVAFDGKGPEGKHMLVGLERKTIGDLITSLSTKRFTGHQLPGLLRTYDSVGLIVEGFTRPKPDGKIMMLESRSRWREWTHSRMTWGAMVKQLQTISMCTGVQVYWTHDTYSTAALVLVLYQWWQRDYEKHKTHLAIGNHTPHVSLAPVSTLRRIAYQLHGIGWERSKAVERHFGSVREMANADESEWMKIPGIGKELAKSIVKQLRGGRDE